MVVEKFVNPFRDPFSALKFFTELLILVLFIILFIIFYLKIRRTTVLKEKGYYEFMLFIILGIILNLLDVLDNWLWFTADFYRFVWKPTKMILMFIGALFLSLGFTKYHRAMLISKTKQ